ncbi:ATP phosphoribosyltransferase regulatory subunit [Moraxella sp. Tifton1]|uniref:ATP phosphoribosyltransferase regulatory subunit n=1 Tax=Moraxella oculi TaxID=2940516 RepID=UPI0020137F89|nr:ATP phosphoribosyltransferase regulatory subunit [Moraxella sp. Tifton1]MCL1623194.1 ATP phosphoribosyltransferase regulatory subunit [Moraxella sp. Tifton1]
MATNLRCADAQNWLLPDGVADVLFKDAQKLESLRDALLFVLTAHGYRLVSPPIIEYTETLLGGADEDLKRQTFKLVDQLTGRMMGLRADMTPQITRIDAQHGRGISRYCYIGQVVKTLPTGLFGLRTPLQLGAEIFGVSDVGAEIALIDLLMALTDEIGMSRDNLHVDVGHVAIFDALCKLYDVDVHTADGLMKLYIKKNLPELEKVCLTIDGGADFLVLAKHTLTQDAVPTASHLLSKLSPKAQADETICHAAQEIATLTSHIKSLGISVSVDITELSGYHYHTGLVFNVYLNQTSTAQTQALVRGGRFCASIGRQATGFSMDINRLLEFVELQEDTVILVDYQDMANASKEQIEDLAGQIKTLQDEGCIVIKPLSAEDGFVYVDGVMHLDGGEWVVRLVGDDD